jgi:hypothetical protein
VHEDDEEKLEEVSGLQEPQGKTKPLGHYVGM